MFKELNDQELDNFLAQQKYSQFLQTSFWAKFQRALGNRVWQIGIEENGLKASALVIEKKLLFNLTYLYLPRGPIIADDVQDKNKYLSLILKAVRDLSIQTEKRAEVFFRIEPLNNFKLENVQKVKSVQPKNTLILDLSKNKEKLLAEMHSKTRYNIRLAKKKGILIEKLDYSQEFLSIFNNLLKQTSNRDRFIPYQNDYYQKMLESMKSKISLWRARYKNETLVMNIVLHFGDTVTYLHGASSNKYKNLMAPHLLQWEQIKWAQAQGFKLYDFWGISNSNPHWAGFTRFKKGFGGYEKHYPGTFDLVYNQRAYQAYRFAQRFLKIIKMIK